MKTPEVRAALKAHHAQGAWVWVEEAFNIDFLAMACHGHYSDRRDERRRLEAIHPWRAIEIKVSRSDFRSELRKPGKRAFAMDISHEFYFCAPKGLIKPHELPEGCGLMEATKAGVAIRVKAPLTEASPLGPMHTALMFRHGWNPSFVRYHAERIATERAKRRYAEQDAKEEKRRRVEVEDALSKFGRAWVTVGESWSRIKPYAYWDYDNKVVVAQVSDDTVLLESPNFRTPERRRIADLLLNYRPT